MLSTHNAQPIHATLNSDQLIASTQLHRPWLLPTMTSVWTMRACGARLQPCRSAAAFRPAAATAKSRRSACQVACAARGGAPEQGPLELVPAPNTPPASSSAWGPGPENGLVMGAVVGFQV